MDKVLPGAQMGKLNDVVKTSYGIPTTKHMVLAIIVFIGMILVWVGSSMIISQIFTGSGSQRTNYGGGGVLMVIGLSAMGAVNLYRTL